jgi:hypothetical protein
MKRLTLKQKLRQKRISRWRLKDLRRRRGRGKPLPGDRFTRPTEKITAPASFNLIRGGGKEVVKFLRALNDRVLVQKKQVTLDFKATKQFYVPGAILLYAEIDRIVATSGMIKPITVLDPVQRKSREVLKQIGLHQLTGDRSDVVPTREDVVYWKATKGHNQTGDSYGGLVEAVAEKANKDHVKQVALNGLWRSVNEAVANSIEHAYLHPRFDGFSGLQGTRWWMFTQVREGTFTIAVCDLGCGYIRTINETIPERVIANIWAKFPGANRDALAIDTAMEFGRSGTGEMNRGKGSRDALSLLEKHGSGRLVVLSNTGWMRYEFADGKQISKNSGDMKIVIGGTVIWWNLPLKESGNASR